MSSHLEERHEHADAHGHDHHEHHHEHETHDHGHRAGLVNEGPPLNREPAPTNDARDVGVVEGVPPQARHDVGQTATPPAERATPQHQDMPDAVEHAGNAHPTAEEGRSAAPGGDVYRDLELTPPPSDGMDRAGAAPAATDGKELEKRTVVELRKLAGELKIPNRSRLSKAALIQAIREKQA